MIRFWRAYTLNLEKDGRLGLRGAYKAHTWTSGSLKANCSDRDEMSQEVVLRDIEVEAADTSVNRLVTNLYVGQLLKPQPKGRVADVQGFALNKAYYEQLCEEHLLNADCHCGIWGYKTAGDLRDYGGYLPSYWYGAKDQYGDDVAWTLPCASVSSYQVMPELKVLVACIGWGAYHEGERGYRVQYAQIDRIYLPVLPCNSGRAIRYSFRKTDMELDRTAKMSFECSHPTPKAYTTIPVDPNKAATALSKQFECPAITCTPELVMQNIVARGGGLPE